MSPAKHTMTPSRFAVGTTHAEIICSPTLRLTKTRRVGTKNLKFELIRLKDRFPPGEYLVKLVERMPRVCKAVIKAKSGYFEEAQI